MVRFSECRQWVYRFPKSFVDRCAVHASILRLGSGLSTNGGRSISEPFTLSLSKPVLSLSKGVVLPRLSPF